MRGGVAHAARTRHTAHRARLPNLSPAPRRTPVTQEATMAVRSLDGFLLCACTAGRRGGDAHAAPSRVDDGELLLRELEPAAGDLLRVLADVH